MLIAFLRKVRRDNCQMVTVAMTMAMNNATGSRVAKLGAKETALSTKTVADLDRPPAVEE